MQIITLNHLTAINHLGESKDTRNELFPSGPTSAEKGDFDFQVKSQILEVAPLQNHVLY